MPIFRRGRKGPTLAPDRTLGNARARRLLAAGAEGDWETVRDGLSTATDWDERELVLSVVTEQPEAAAWIQEWVAAEPDSPLALTADGANRVYGAWEVRGGGFTASSEQFAAFHALLAEAEDQLRRAAAADVTDPTPWVFLLVAARGLEVDPDELEARFAEVTARHATHRFAHNQMLQGLTAKWGGSHDTMFGFARRASERAPEGSGLHSLVAEAHVERNVAYMFSQPPDRQGFEEYWRRPKVVEEVRAAAERSVLSPAFTEYARAAFDRNLFAYCFWMADLVDDAAPIFAALGDVVSDYPWYYLGDSGQAYARARDESSG